ncbi:MAG: transcription termination/antitermination protein NusA, partial [Paludibacteraceae bacterium]|nr:transcription termination/antitermination protein NusA [Paludibacteraceae bacterium]
EQDMDDIYLDEFNDEIDQWVLDAFKAIGLDTAKDVLGMSKEQLLAQTDLEEETIDEVLRILAAEFAND